MTPAAQTPSPLGQVGGSLGLSSIMPFLSLSMPSQVSKQPTSSSSTSPSQSLSRPSQIVSLSFSNAGDVYSHVQPRLPAQVCFTSAHTPFVLHAVGQSSGLSSIIPFLSLSIPSQISGVTVSAKGR